MQPSEHDLSVEGPALSDPERQPVEGELRAFVVENFLFGGATPRLSGNDSFLERGIIDSTGILELVAFIEDRYHIRVEDRELVPDNLDSINRLVEFIRRKQPAQLCV
jgi:acyl carrier protein